MLRLFGILTLALSLAFAFAAKADVSADCPFSLSAATGHMATGHPSHDAMAPAKPDPGSHPAEQSAPCKQVCSLAAFAMPVPDPSDHLPLPSTLSAIDGHAPVSLTHPPSRRPPRLA